jgi:Tetratricopeptide repeat
MWRLGDREGALAIRKHNLAIEERTRGLEDLQTLILSKAVARTLRALGRRDEARLVLERSLRAYERASGAADPEAQEARKLLASLGGSGVNGRTRRLDDVFRDEVLVF